MSEKQKQIGEKHAENEGREVAGLNQRDVAIPSSYDGTNQPAIVQAPEGYDGSKPIPLLVGLHTWGGDTPQQRNRMGKPAADRGWLMVLPRFRGPNRTTNPDAPKACASLYAQHDIVDAVDYMVAHYAVDRNRIYLLGASGGGHMALMMASKYPDLWAGVSAWVGLTDLAAWHVRAEHTPGRERFARDVEACCGGRPGASPEVDWEYLRRSPFHFIRNALHVNLDIQAGERDHNRDHSVRAYERLSELGDVRPHLTVFDGGHEIHEEEAFAWLSSQVRDPIPPDRLFLTTDESKAYYYLDLEVAGPMRLARCELRVTSPDALSLSAAFLKSVTLHVDRSPLKPGEGLEIEVKSEDSPLTLRLAGLRKVKDVAGVGIPPPVWRGEAGGIAIDIAEPGRCRITLE